MQRRSSLARAQQIGTLVLGAAGIWWLLSQWRGSPALAIGGVLILWFGYAVVLAVEFVALRRFGGDEAAPPPTWLELARAWLAETWLNALVFAWLQPFRWHAIPDQLETADGRRGVVLIHGFVCNRGFWTPWLKHLRARGIPFAAVNLEPAFGSIDSYPPIIEDAVQRVTAATGLAPVLICHSMGGVAVRAWLRTTRVQRAHRVITIGSPHHGTWFGRFSHAINGRQMALGSAWIRELGAALPPDARARFTCWYSDCDNIVFPVSTATLEGADNRMVHGRAHIELGYAREVVRESLALVTSA